MATWGEIKRKIEAAGVKDDDEIGYIDVSGDVTDVSRDTCDVSWQVE